MHGGDPQKILVVRFSSIGDVVLTTPVLRRLRRRFPAAQIHFLVKAKYAGLLDGNPHVDRVLTLPDAAGSRTLLQTIRTLRAESYDLLVDLHKNLRSTVVRLAGVARSAVAYRKQVFRRALYVATKRRSFALPTVVERYFGAVTQLGVIDDGQGPELHLSAAVKRKTVARLRQMGWRGGLTVGLVPGAGYFTKRWPPERFGELARQLQMTLGCQLFIFGGKEDRRTAESVAGSAGPAALNLAGRLSLPEAVAALECCDLVVANDTGLMHVADALGKNLVAIFGSTTNGLGFFPHGSWARVVEVDLECRPCSHLGRSRCPKGHFRCMREISVADVRRTAEALYRAQPCVPT